MTKTIGLAAYLFRAKTVRAKDWEVMQTGTALDMWAHLTDYFDDRRGQLVNLQNLVAEEQRSKVSRCFRLRGRVRKDKPNLAIYGLVEAGNFGRAGSITNKDTGKRAYHKKVNEADLAPFYFRIEVPEGDTRGLFIAQRSGLSGFKSAMETDMRKFLHARDVTIGLDLFADETILAKYLTRAELTKITVVTHKRKNDAREAIRDSRVDGEPIKDGMQVELKISGKQGLVGMMRTVRQIATGRKEPSSLVVIKGLENPEEVTVEIDTGGEKKSFSLTHPDEAGFSYDVTNEVSYGRDNHPRLDSINRLAAAWCTKLRGQL